MRFTEAERQQRARDKALEAGLVRLHTPITPEQRDEFKSVLAGESKIVKVKKNGNDKG